MKARTLNIVTVRAHPNIAFIKYWGNADETLRLPANPSISMNLDGVYTETRVRWDDQAASDTLMLNGRQADTPETARVITHLDAIRQRTGATGYAHVETSNNFPTGAGIASSASGFAALTLAATAAAGINLTEIELSCLARLGSGSAARSIPGGFVEWITGDTHEASFAQSFAPTEHWELADVITIVNKEHKRIGSKHGHMLALTSDLQPARVAGAFERFVICKRAVLERDFATFAEVVELDSTIMHAVMMTSNPPLFYWEPASLAIMKQVREWREAGLHVCYTLDAGPNVHCLCLEKDVPRVVELLHAVPGVIETRIARPGVGAKIISMDSIS